MRQKQTIAIIGTGAVGGYYGALLQQAGHHLHFLLRSDFDQVQRQGLKISSPNGDIILPNVHAHASPDTMPPCDLAIVALKTTANHQLQYILPRIIKDAGAALTLQNGLGSDQLIARLIGPERTLGGLCFLCACKVAPGHIVHQDYGLITLGEFSQKGITPRLESITNLLKEAAIPAQSIEDLKLARWKKLVWNVPFNGLSVLHHCLTDHLISNPALRQLSIDLMHEVVEAAAVCAGIIEPAFIDQMIDNTEKMVPYAPSMKVDFDNNRPMELESIYGEPIRQACACGIEMPQTNALYLQLHQLNGSRSADPVLVN
jgi:2-dehydropantoate 2-reductase